MQARSALDQYREHIFPAYEATINDSLKRFAASFRFGSVRCSQSTRDPANPHPIAS